MLFKSIISTLLLASAVLADRRHLQHRRSLNHLEHLTNLVSRGATETMNGTAGAILAGNDISSASTTVKLPEANGGTAIFMLGLDLNGDCFNFLVGGINVNMSGYHTYQGWGMFETDPGITLYNMTFSAGDEVTLTMTVNSKNAGNFTIVNETKKKSEYHSFQSSDPLCFSTITVSLGASDGNNGYLPLPNFGQATFANTQLTTASGKHGIGNGDQNDTLINMELNGKIVATASIEKGDIIVKQQK